MICATSTQPWSMRRLRLLFRCVCMVRLAIVHSGSITTNVQDGRCECQARTTDEGRLNALSCQLAQLEVFLANNTGSYEYEYEYNYTLIKRLSTDHETNMMGHIPRLTLVDSHAVVTDLNNVDT